MRSDIAPSTWGFCFIFSTSDSSATSPSLSPAPFLWCPPCAYLSMSSKLLGVIFQLLLDLLDRPETPDFPMEDARAECSSL